MSLMSFYRRYARPLAALLFALLAVSLVIGVATTDVGGARHGALHLGGTAVGLVLLGVVAAVPRLRISLTWPAFLVAAWGVAAAAGPGVVGGPARLLAWVVAGASLVLAIGACIVHYDVTQERPVSRL